jgi:hypothetical protein
MPVLPGRRLRKLWRSIRVNSFNRASPSQVSWLVSLLVVLLCVHIALGLASAPLAAVATSRFAAALSTVVGAAGILLLFGHDDPFAR